jgi:hypothetical protein
MRQQLPTTEGHERRTLVSFNQLLTAAKAEERMLWLSIDATTAQCRA